MRTVRRILKIHKIDGFKVFCLFNNGESRIIDFNKVFKKGKVKKGDLKYPLYKSVEEFGKVELVDGTLAWRNAEIKGMNDVGNEVIYCYDLDPIVLYELSELDESRQIGIGLMIKQVRNELGLTQEQLAERSGTSKHHISRLENNRTGIELATLIRIIEGGLGRKMNISIQ